jgi:hypothetical protein
MPRKIKKVKNNLKPKNKNKNKNINKIVINVNSNNKRKTVQNKKETSQQPMPNIINYPAQMPYSQPVINDNGIGFHRLLDGLSTRLSTLQEENMHLKNNSLIDEQKKQEYIIRLQEQQQNSDNLISAQREQQYINEQKNQEYINRIEEQQQNSDNLIRAQLEQEYMNRLREEEQKQEYKRLRKEKNQNNINNLQSSYISPAFSSINDQLIELTKSSFDNLFSSQPNTENNAKTISVEDLFTSQPNKENPNNALLSQIRSEERKQQRENRRNAIKEKEDILEKKK